MYFEEMSPFIVFIRLIDFKNYKYIQYKLGAQL